jgi:subtilisin family serine protease
VSVVSAAGNDNGQDACNVSPASAPNVIAVGASTEDDTIAGYSNTGRCIATYAPGTHVLGGGVSSDTHAFESTGTSMAVPHVAVRATPHSHDSRTAPLDALVV